MAKKVVIGIYHIIKYSWEMIICKWPVMGFRQISHATGSQWKGENGSVDITQNDIITQAFSAWYDDRLLNPQ
jgi:hypothetical protein